jgi:hypothetical protein
VAAPSIVSSKVSVHEICAEHQLRHLDRVAGAFRVSDRPHERLVAVLDMAVHHVEVALVDRKVHGLADRAAGMVDTRAHIGELHEVPEVLDFPVTPALVQVTNERRPVGGNEHSAVATDLDAPCRIAGVLGEFPGCRRLNNGTAKTARKAYTFAVDIRARLAPQLQCLWKLAKFDADLFEHRLRVVLDQLERLVIEHLEIRNTAVDPSAQLGGRLLPRRPLGFPTSASFTSRSAIHVHLGRGFSECPETLWNYIGLRSRV